MAFKDDEERRAYFREYNKGWYLRHKERLLATRKLHNEELREWLKRYKSELHCVECGENHPACLQFHHRERTDKSFTIASIIGSTSISVKRLEEEISKCDILCGNCHAKLHWQERQVVDNGGGDYAL